MEWQKLAPVAVSILLIICIAVARAYSRTFAAIVSTMPINIALALWIVSSGDDGRPAAMTEFSASMLRGIASTVVFVLVAWLAARAGWGLLPLLLISYLAWAVALGLIFWVFGG